MKKIVSVILLAALLLLQVFAVSAMSADDAKDAWKETKKHSLDMREQHQEAKFAFASDKSDENRQEVVDTGKALLHGALEEAESWLIWKKLEVQENPGVPEHIKESIEDSVETNLDKIDGLKTDVDGIENQVELGLVTLKMIGKYFELVSDVTRNSGALLVHIANTKADKIEEFESKLRSTAEDLNDEEALEHLDDALAELEIARRNIDNAEDTYRLVKLPGTPLIKFSEGNNYLRAARTNLIGAHRHLNLAYLEIVR